MFLAKSVSRAQSSSAVHAAGKSTSWIVYLLTVILFATQSIAAANLHGPDGNRQPRLAQQLAKIPVGTQVKVQMADGQTHQGALVARTETHLEILEPGQATPRGFECVDLKSIKATPSAQGRPRWLGTALLFGGCVAAIGVSAAMAGTIW